MGFVFTELERTPFDKNIIMTIGGKFDCSVTYGSCSYFNNAITSSNSASHPFNILIGRFSSLAINIEFLIGEQHDYKNVVTTYPFNEASVVDEIISAANLQRSNYIPKRAVKENHYQVIIGNDVWIGQNATIKGGVKIGSGAIIGTNAMVTKDIPPYAIAVGNPIKVIKYRFDEETIKKFMAIKWWNWSIEKIYQNLPLIKNVEGFLEKHYSSTLEKNSENNLGGGGEIEKYHAEGRKIFAFIADFNSHQSLWRRVVSGFCRSTLQSAVLIIGLGENATQENIDELKKFVTDCGIADGKIIYCIPNFSPSILRQVTHFITSREMTSLECVDCLWDTDVKIISALDDGIFDGEPDIDWNEIFVGG